VLILVFFLNFCEFFSLDDESFLESMNVTSHHQDFVGSQDTPSQEYEQTPDEMEKSFVDSPHLARRMTNYTNKEDLVII
jgi:hypothetical protein